MGTLILQARGLDGVVGNRKMFIFYQYNIRISLIVVDLFVGYCTRSTNSSTCFDFFLSEMAELFSFDLRKTNTKKYFKFPV